MFFTNILIEDKNFVPGNVKRDTCVAVAYSMLTGTDYDDALKMFPNGRITTIKKHLDLQETNVPLKEFLLNNKRGKFIVCINDNKHSSGHALAVINGTAYNMQDFSKDSTVTHFADLSNISKSTSNETSYLDEFDKHKNIKDNKYINYAYQKVIDNFNDKLSKNGTIRTRIKTLGTDGFELSVNNTKFSFKFPFNCSDQEIYKEIDNIIEKTIV